MSNNRDDFSPATKELLANRVGRKCSNPACRKLTCGANEDPQKVTSIGVAAHICAAAKGGPRYDATMTSQERKLIDTDVVRYTKETLLSWKQIAEQLSIIEIETTSPVQTLEHDKNLFSSLSSALTVQLFKTIFFKRAGWKILIKQSKILLLL